MIADPLTISQRSTAILAFIPHYIRYNRKDSGDYAHSGIDISAISTDDRVGDRKDKIYLSGNEPDLSW